MRTRLSPIERERDIIKAAVVVAVEKHFMLMTREQVAEAAGVSPALVSHYYGDMDGLRDAVVSYAIARKVEPVIVQAKLARHPLVTKRQ